MKQRSGKDLVKSKQAFAAMSMKRQEYLVWGIIGLLALVLVVLPMFGWTLLGKSPVGREELSRVEGTVVSLEYVKGGRRSSPYLRLQLREHPSAFVLTGTAFDAVDVHLLRERVQLGSQLVLQVKTDALQKSSEQNGLKALFNWYKTPKVYALETENKVFLTLEQYNAEAEVGRSDNRFWGLVFVLMLAAFAYHGKLQDEAKRAGTRR